MFLTCRPAIGYLCICAFAPLILAGTWSALGWQLLTHVRRFSPPHHALLRALVAIAFVLVPYILFRAGGDMFTLSVRYHLWRAGGAQKVQAEFNQWVAVRPSNPSSQEKYLFFDVPPGGGITTPIAAAKFPPAVRYMHQHFPTSFGMSWDGVARIDNVSVLTMTDIMIGPPGWEPPGGASIWDHLTGSRASSPTASGSALGRMTSDDLFYRHSAFGAAFARGA